MSNHFVALDVETAIGKRYSICQIGLAFFENNKLTQTITRYVQPPNNEYFFMNISVHKITPDQTINEPFFPEIWNEIYPLIKDAKLVAHNASFDKSCLNKALEFYEIEVPAFDFDCTYKMTGEKLNNACEAYQVPLEKHHDAACDAEACGLLYVKLKQAHIEMPVKALKKKRTSKNSR